jgi:CubicO group peptidase (beta-lactamase class C family)
VEDSWEREARALGVTSSNWLDAPYNRLGFRGVGRLVRTAPISRGEGPMVELPRAEHDLGGFRFEHEGRTLDVDAMLTETYTDGFLVVHDGAVIAEHYFNGMEPFETHLLMSVSKSFNSTLCGALVADGALTPDDLVPDHVDELQGSAWEGCTVQHLLDMRVGARWDYDADEYTILDVSDYRTHDRTDIPADTATWIRTVGRAGDHGGPFAYNSLANDVLGWVLERAGGKPYPELFSDRIWSRLGAEHDAEIMLDHTGFAIVEGGFCATLRDLARFGLMSLQGGELEERRIHPAAWSARRRVRDEALIAAFGEENALGGPPGEAFYHDNWWIWDARRGVYAGVGMNGQSVFVHHPSNTVVAKLSTFPDPLDEGLFALHHAGMSALCESLV